MFIGSTLNTCTRLFPWAFSFLWQDTGGVGFLEPLAGGGFFSAQVCLDTTPPPMLGQQEFLPGFFVPPEGREWLPPGMLIA